MGILDTVGKIVEEAEKVESTDKDDPDASLLKKGIDTLTGEQGADVLDELKELVSDAEGTANAPDSDDTA